MNEEPEIPSPSAPVKPRARPEKGYGQHLLTALEANA